MNSRLSTISSILQKPPYLLLTGIASVGFGVLHYVLSLSLLDSHFETVFEAIPQYIAISLGLSVVIAVLAGINIAMIVYKFKSSRVQSVKHSGGSALGSVFGVFTPGCPACTTPLAVVLGTVGGLAIFPLQGLELKFVSIGALAFAIYWIAGKVSTPSCCSIKDSKPKESVETTESTKKNCNCGHLE